MSSGSLTYSPALFRLMRRRRGWTLDADALDSLYRDHSRQLLVYFARRTMDADAATDLMAETFAVAFRDRRQFRGGTHEEAVGWLFGIARHQLSSFYRRGSVEREAFGRLAVERRDLSAEEFERVEELAGLAELRAVVRDRLVHLEPADQEILRLRIVEERPYDEIAEQLSLTEDATRARVSRALRRLRELMHDGDSERGLAA